MTFRPKKVSASRSRGVLLIDWEDGHHSEYPVAGLRAACPCAGCRDEQGGSGKGGSPEMLEIPLTPAATTELDNMEGVGNYALQLLWKDGHSDGIYTWEYLRALCPCGEHHRDA